MSILHNLPGNGCDCVDHGQPIGKYWNGATNGVDRSIEWGLPQLWGQHTLIFAGAWWPERSLRRLDNATPLPYVFTEGATELSELT